MGRMLCQSDGLLSFTKREAKKAWGKMRQVGATWRFHRNNGNGLGEEGYEVSRAVLICYKLHYSEPRYNSPYPSTLINTIATTNE